MLALALSLTALLTAAPGTATTTTATTGPILRATPLVLIFPTRALENVRSGSEVIPKARVAAFSQELSEAARSVYAWRRWDLAPPSVLEQALGERAEECDEARCRGQVANGLGASAWIETTLAELSPKDPNASPKQSGRCLVQARRYRLPSNQTELALDQEVQPCTADNLLAAALDLGQRLADGPQAPVRVTLNLTPLEVPDLDIPNIASLRRIVTSTAVRTRQGFELERALQIYKAQHIFMFRDQGQQWVARNGTLLRECDLRLAASAPLPDEIRSYCYGNDWEWGWLGVPAGGLVALGSLSGFQDGDLLGVVGLTVGMGTAITSALLAVLFNEDAKPANEHVYLSSWRELETIVNQANQALRKSLDLTEAEVELAGLPK